MSKRRGKRSASPSENKIVESKIPFATYFQRKVDEGRLGSWQLNEINQFFKQKGLSDLEFTYRYEELLKLY